MSPAGLLVRGNSGHSRILFRSLRHFEPNLSRRPGHTAPKCATREFEATMDRSEETRTETAALAKVLEGIAGKLKAERDLSDEAIGLAMLQTGLKSLVKVWDGQEMVDHMAELTGDLMAAYRVRPNGETVPRGRPN
jgi:hypothetical protein